MCFCPYLACFEYLGLPCLVEELAPQIVELAADAAVEHQVADPRHDAADEIGVDGGFQDHLLAGPRLERQANPVERGGVERLGGGHPRANAPGVGVGQVAI